MRTPALLLVLASFVANAEPSPAPVDPGEVLHKTFVPSAKRRHGEVRLTAASNQCVRVESVLFTSQLARGFHQLCAERPGPLHELGDHRFGGGAPLRA